MSIYTLALFVHIVGALGAFIGVSVWLFAALALRHAGSVGQVRALSSLIQPSGVLAVASLVLLGRRWVLYGHHGVGGARHVDHRGDHQLPPPRSTWRLRH